MTGNALAVQFANVTFEPVLKIAPGMLFKAEPQEGEPPLHVAIRELTATVREKLAPPPKGEESMHGFKGTGAVIAMYSNCPNNSLPILRDQTPDWDALFPRIKRN